MVSIPGNLATITVTGSYVNADGSPAAGNVRFTPTSAIIDASGAVIIPATAITATLGNGSFSVTLPCTDNGNLAPSAWGYVVHVNVNGITGTQSQFTVMLPHTLGAVVDISALTPAANTFPVPSTAFNTPNTWTATQTFAGNPATKMPVGAVAGSLWTSDSAGNGSWSVVTQPQITQAQRVTTTSDLTTYVLAASTPPSFAPVLAAGPGDIIVRPGDTHQQFLGTGAALTDSAAYVLVNYMSSSQRTSLITDLFSPAQSGWTMLRVCMGSSDFRSEASVYTYDDMPSGQTDPGLLNFSVTRDTTFIIPVLQQILTINPGIRIVAAPWTPPQWMLASGTVGTAPETFTDANMAAYAQYFVQFIQAYQALGIPIWAVTPANEPVVPTWMTFTQSEETTFVGTWLGPALAAAGLNTKILAFDDNWSQGTAYAAGVLGSATAGQYIAGAAWHGYAGGPATMSQLHAAYPAALQVQSEWRSLAAESLSVQMAGMAGGYVVGGVRNWSNAVLLWNLALDQNGAPNQGAAGRIGVVTVNNSTGAVTKNAGYYALRHLSDYVQQGAVRCGSTTFGAPYVAYTTYPSSVVTCAFVNPDGSVVLYAYNGSSNSQSFQIIDERSGTGFPVTMVAGELSTFIWGTTRQSQPAVIPSTPAAPSAPVLTAVAGSGQVNLSWTVPSSAAPVDWYVIGRATSPGTETTLVQVPAGTTSYLDLTGAAGTWYYTVTAVSAGGIGVPSVEQSASPGTSAAPAAPVISSASAGTSVILSWPPPVPNGAVITSFNILRGTSSGTETSLGTAPQGSAGYTDGTGSIGTTYYYKVQAVNSAGTSAFSNEVTGSPAGVSIDTESTSSSDANVGGGVVTSLTWNHAVGGGAHSILLVYVGYAGIASPPRVSSVKYGGISLTKLLTADPSPGAGTDRALDVWYLVAPPSGTAAILVSLSSGSSLVCAGVSAAGVSQATPFGTAVPFTSTSSNAPSAATTGGATTDLVLAGLHMRGANTVTPGGSQTDIVTYAQINGANNQLLVSRQAGGTGTITSSFSWTTADMTALIAVALKAG